MNLMIRLDVLVALKRVAAPCLCVGVMAIVEGILITMMAVIVAKHEKGALLTAINHVTPALILLIATFYMEKPMKEYGIFKSKMFFIIAASMSTVLYAATSSSFWLLMLNRGLNGLFLGGSFLVMDSWISMSSSFKHRGLVLGIYGSMIGLGITIGGLLMVVLPPDDPVFFVLAAILLQIPLAITIYKKNYLEKLDRRVKLAKPKPEIIDSSAEISTLPKKEKRLKYLAYYELKGQSEYTLQQTKVGIILLFACATLGNYLCVSFEGMVPWGIISLQGEDSIIPMLLAVFALGGVCFRGFLGWLSDRLGRFKVLLGICMALSICCLLSTRVIELSGIPFAWLSLTFLVGGMTSGIFTVGWAALIDFQPGKVILHRNLINWRFGQIGLLVSGPTMGWYLSAYAENKPLQTLLYLLAITLVAYLLMLTTHQLFYSVKRFLIHRKGA